MSRLSRLLLAALVIALGAGTLHAGPILTDEDDNSYDVDFYNETSSEGTVYLDGNSVCTLSPRQYCSKTLAKSSGSHTGLFHASTGHELSQTFDADTCGDRGSVSLAIYDDHVEVTCNGFAF